MRGALYIHVSALGLLDEDTRRRIEGAERVIGPNWNVAKADTRSVTLLVYEDFDAVAFPLLLRAWRLDEFGSIRFLDYSTRENPPILHRKELLLRHDDPRRGAFAELTRDAEARGLLADAHKIGTLLGWKARLQEKGVEVVGHRLAEAAVARHRTAIARSRLSTPVQHLLVHGFVNEDVSFFDYGCGQGDDVRVLREAGLEANGWDPHFAHATPRRAADTVNLGFVLNVIEDPTERREALLRAWTLARRVLSVAVMVVGQAPTEGLKPFADGFLTSRGTFQKYFAQAELRELVASVTGSEPVTVAPGIVFAFREGQEAQDFLFRRQSRTRSLPDWLPSFSAPRLERDRTARAEAAPLVETVAGAWLALGRRPVPEELPPSTLAAVNEYRTTPKRLIDWAGEEIGDEKREAAASARLEDLTLSFAMRSFGRTEQESLSSRLRRDARHFFGSVARAEQQGRDFLFSLGRNNAVLDAMEQAVAAGRAHAVGGRFHFLRRDADEMPLAIRGFLACVAIVAGDLEEIDLVVANPTKGTATLVVFADFNAKLPLIVRTTKVLLARHDLSDRRFEPGSRPLFLHRSAYAADDQDRAERAALEDKIRRLLALATDATFCDERDLALALRKGATGGA